MKNKIVQKISVSLPSGGNRISFYTLAIIILCVTSCSKDELAGGGMPSANGTDGTNRDIYFRLNFKEVDYPYKVNIYTTYGTPSLGALTIMDATGDSATEIRIIVPQFVRGLIGSAGRVGDLDVYFKLIKKGRNLIGTYTTEVRDSAFTDYFPRPRISIMSLTPGSHDNGGYLIDSAGLEFNITKEGISDTDGAFVEGDFSFNLNNQLYISKKIPVTGTFRLFRN